MTRRKKPRRVFGRCLVDLIVPFWSLDDPDGPHSPMKGSTVDLSEGGLLLRCHRFDEGFLDGLVNHDARFGFRIQKSGSRDWARGVAEVVWIEESGAEFLIRACFDELDDESRRRIRSVVASGSVENATLS